MITTFGSKHIYDFAHLFYLFDQFCQNELIFNKFVTWNLNVLQFYGYFILFCLVRLHFWSYFESDWVPKEERLGTQDFADHMPFLSPNQQCQSTELNTKQWHQPQNKSSAQQLLREATLWPQQTWAEKWELLCPFPLGGAGSPSNTMSPGQDLPPYQVASWSIQPFGHNTPTLHTDRHDRQQSHSIGQTVSCNNRQKNHQLASSSLIH